MLFSVTPTIKVMEKPMIAAAIFPTNSCMHGMNDLVVCVSKGIGKIRLCAVLINILFSSLSVSVIFFSSHKLVVKAIATRIKQKKPRWEGFVSALNMQSRATIFSMMVLMIENQTAGVLCVFRLLISNLEQCNKAVNTERKRIAWSCSEMAPVFIIWKMWLIIKREVKSFTIADASA